MLRVQTAVRAGERVSPERCEVCGRVRVEDYVASHPAREGEVLVFTSPDKLVNAFCVGHKAAS